MTDNQIKTDKEVKDEIANKNPELIALKNEDTVDISLVELADDSDADSKITDCLKHIEINKQPLTDSDLRLAKIILDVTNTTNGQYQPFVEMFQEATTLAGSTSNYVTGLRMHFGVDNQHNLCLFYQPVGLSKFINSNPLKPKENLYDVHPSNNYYTYNGLEFIKVADNNILRAYYEEYQHQLGIKHNGVVLQSHKKHEDTESFIFPFQEIFRVIKDNEETNKNLFIFNMIESDGIVLRHKAALAPDNVVPRLEFSGGNLHLKYADLVHLCPPHCHRIQVTLE